MGSRQGCDSAEGSAVKVAGWGLSELLAKHGDECAWAGIANFQSSYGDFFSARDQLNCAKQPQLLAPSVESNSSFRQENTFDGPFTRATLFAEFCKSPLIVWFVEERPCHTRGT